MVWVFRNIFFHSWKNLMFPEGKTVTIVKTQSDRIAEIITLTFQIYDEKGEVKLSFFSVFWLSWIKMRNSFNLLKCLSEFWTNSSYECLIWSFFFGCSRCVQFHYWNCFNFFNEMKLVVVASFFFCLMMWVKWWWWLLLIRILLRHIYTNIWNNKDHRTIFILFHFEYTIFPGFFHLFLSFFLVLYCMNLIFFTAVIKFFLLFFFCLVFVYWFHYYKCGIKYLDITGVGICLISSN